MIRGSRRLGTVRFGGGLRVNGRVLPVRRVHAQARTAHMGTAPVAHLNRAPLAAEPWVLGMVCIRAEHMR